MALAVSGTTIAALAAMVAGAGLQYKASADAQKRSQEEIRRSLASQKALQLKAEQRALDTAKTFDTPQRAEEQTQIADQLTAQMMAPVSESQAIRADQQTTQGDVSNDYTTAKAASDVNAIKSAQSLAKLLGKSSSANRLRMNEGIRMLDTGQDIDRLGGFSRGQAGADGVAIQQAGQVDPGMQFAGSLLQTAGSAGLSFGGGGGASGANYGGLPSYSADAAVTGAQTPAWNSVFTQVPGRAVASSSLADGFKTKATGFLKGFMR
ncbi:MAG: hypothetical protein ACRC7C_19910 [Beijerinckiaceae bacterium]